MTPFSRQITGNETRHTLLRRACDPADQWAWREFHENYKRFIFYILKEIGVNRDEIEDVAQEILVTLTEALPRYDRSRAKFRTWLSAVIRNIALTHLRAARTRRRYHEQFGNEPEGPHDCQEPELDRLIQNEWETYISTLAMARVRQIFRGQAVEVFELGLDGCPPAEIAERTGLSIASIYTMRKRVKKRLYQEIRAITRELEP